MVFLGVRVFRVGLSFTVPLGWEGVSSWVDTSGVWNVAFFNNILLSGIVIALRRVDGASFRTLNSRMPNLSQAGQIFEDIEVGGVSLGLSFVLSISDELTQGRVDGCHCEISKFGMLVGRFLFWDCQICYFWGEILW